MGLYSARHGANFPAGFDPHAHWEDFRANAPTVLEAPAVDVVTDDMIVSDELSETTLELRSMMLGNAEHFRACLRSIFAYRKPAKRAYAMAFMRWAWGTHPQPIPAGLSKREAREIELSLARFGVVNPDTGSPF